MYRFFKVSYRTLRVDLSAVTFSMPLSYFWIMMIIIMGRLLVGITQKIDIYIATVVHSSILSLAIVISYDKKDFLSM